MSGRTNIAPSFQTPAPNAYETTGKSYRAHSTPACHIGEKHKGISANNNPGVGEYNIDRSNRGPKYSMSSRTATAPQNNNPAPNAYKGENYRTLVKSAPSYSMSHRTNIQPRNTNPGVGEYNIDNNTTKPRPPAFSLRSRNDKLPIDQTPAPNAYHSESCPRGNTNAPAYSLSSRYATGPGNQNPGVGTYDITND